jgi:hypothetical protein
MKPNSQLTNVEGWIWKKDRLKKKYKSTRINMLSSRPGIKIKITS